MKSHSFFFLTIFAALFFLNLNLFAQNNVISLPAIKDNTLIENADGTLSDGAGAGFRAGRTNQPNNSIRRGVIAFSFADVIPEGATIDSVALTLHMSQTNTGPQPVTLHRLIQDWGEGDSAAGGGMGDSSGVADATWIHTFYDSLFWDNAGGDFNPMFSDSVSVDTVDFYTWGSTDRMVADVQFWIDNPDSNFGWILTGNENETQTVKKFDSRESTIAENQPVLTVRFDSPSSIDEKDNAVPLNFSLAQNYPNPFNIETTIRYTLLEKGKVTLKIFNLLGEQIRTLLDEIKAPGEFIAVWDGRNGKGSIVSSGIYIYEMRVGNFVQAKKAALLK